MSGENWYRRHVLPFLVEVACGLPDVRRQRRKVVPRAAGRVLEIGMGTGLNIPHYDPARIERIVGVDPVLHALARWRIRRAGLDVQLVPLSAEKIPLDDASFDSVVCTYSLCTIPDPVAAVREMRRLLAPGGVLLFCEHGLAPDAGVRRWQRRLQPFWEPLAGGCHLDRDIPAILAQGGFACPDLQSAYLPGPKPLTFHYWGEATPG